MMRSDARKLAEEREAERVALATLICHQIDGHDKRESPMDLDFKIADAVIAAGYKK